MVAIGILSLTISDVHANDIRDLVRERMSQSKDPLVWTQVDLRNFLTKFVDDEGTVNIIVLYVHKKEVEALREGM